MFKILTLNTHKLIAPFTRKYTLLPLREALLEVDADLVFLQEMRGEHPKTDRHTMGSPIEILADGKWPHFIYAANSIYDTGNHGNAIMSKFPILQSRNIDLTNHSREQRGLLWLEVQNPFAEDDLHLANLHLDLTEWGRKRQLEKVNAEIQGSVSKNRPLILAGDFNDWSNKASGLILPKLRTVFDIPPRTFPSVQPLLPLDRVYYAGLKQVHARLLKGYPWNRITDHLPLYAEFELVEKSKDAVGK
jgi:endonuclease/exonuclease/phosphatase family metal-dependent hydrolase